MVSPKTLTRADIARAVQKKLKLSPERSHEIVTAIIDSIVAALGRGENVKIWNFGTFVLRDKRPRVGRNPRTMAEVTITPRRVVTFRASDRLRAQVAMPLPAPVYRLGRARDTEGIQDAGMVYRQESAGVRLGRGYG